MIELLQNAGAKVKIISVPLLRYVLPYHYGLIPSEAASNLARYDGIRYGFSSSAVSASEKQSPLASKIQ